jgi:hypothetical protein
MQAVSPLFITGFVPSGEVLSITKIDPETGVAGSTIHITGTGLAGVRRVTIGTTAAKFVTNSDTSIDATVPVNSDSGKVIVDDGSYSYTSADAYEVINTPAPPVSPPAPAAQKAASDGKKPAQGGPANVNK